MPNKLPFDTGRLSTMSESELYDLATELERIGFWRTEESVQRLVDIYISSFWNKPDPTATYQHVGAPLFSTTIVSRELAEDSYYTVDMPSRRYSDVRIRVPHGIDERTARLFAEQQIREQMDPAFDPTEDDE